MKEGTYVDNSQNRKLGRVGQEYGSGPKDSKSKESKPKDDDKKRDVPTSSPDVKDLHTKDGYVDDSKSKEYQGTKDTVLKLAQQAKEKNMQEMITKITQMGDGKKGAGKYDLSPEDRKQYEEYLKLTPEQREKKLQSIKERQKLKIGPVSEADIDEVINNLPSDIKSKIKTEEIRLNFP